MVKESLQSAENLTVDVLSEEVAKEAGNYHNMIKMLLMKCRKVGLSPEYIQEKCRIISRKSLFGYAFADVSITGRSVEDMVHEAQRKVILELAKKALA